MIKIDEIYQQNKSKVSDMLYTYLDGKQVSHSQTIQAAESIIKLIFDPNDKSVDAERLLNEVLHNYEEEVGIKTYEPQILAKAKLSDSWLYKEKDNINHAFFNRYKHYLRADGFKFKSIKNIEASCEKILAYCANPNSKEEKEQKRGLVVGDVQSGKTANYLGLINMAYDYGYKIVVLLAGTTNSLRIQTQKRTDKGVIGAISDTIGNEIIYCGVGLNNMTHYAIPLTNQTNDFKKFIQKNLNTALSDLKKPVVLVVKKQKGILESVIARLQSTLKDHDTKNILIIDDEADNSSVNTKKDDNDPTTINRCIRQIFNKFPIASYVGFTATPFANIFINPIDEDNENLNLFPSDFIVQLNAPNSYFGCHKVFSEDGNLSKYIRLIHEDEKNFLPSIHKRDDNFNELPDSLKEAIHCFLINCCIRTLRGDINKHRSMMINISQFNDMQDKIWDKVYAYVEKLKNIIEQDSAKEENKFILNEDMNKIYTLFKQGFYQSLDDIKDNSIQWKQIQNTLYDEIKQWTIVVINSRNGQMNQKHNGKKQRFDYENYEHTGARVIAIGGQVLSRGLTLEGLMTSYYNRNAGAYDTLLQMCRWFGYRNGYEDLCRLYISQINIDRFIAVKDAVTNLKEQFSEMDRQGKTPKDFGLMVRESPDTLETTLLVTSRNKMRNTETIICQLSYGGVCADTSKLLKDQTTNKYNLEEFHKFYNNIKFEKLNGKWISSNISKFRIAEFIRNLKIPYVNKQFDTESLSEYIENSEVFPYWDIVIASGLSEKIQNFMGLPGLNAVTRSFHCAGKQDPYIRIGGANNRVIDPGIFNIGLDLTEQDKINILAEKNKNGKGKIYKGLSAQDYLKLREKPLLVVYPIDLKTELSDKEKQDYAAEYEDLLSYKKAIKEHFDNEPLLAFAVGFPKKDSGEKLKYRANKIKLDELLKDIEIDDE